MTIQRLLSQLCERFRGRPRGRQNRSRQKGFTMAEVLLSIIVFTISVVGVVAMQRASLAAESSASVLRAGQRLGSNVMEELQSRSFNELVEFDFMGNTNPTYPFDDLQQEARLFPYRGAPMDVGPNYSGPTPPGMQAGKFRVIRRISALPAGVVPSAAIFVQAVQIDVWVLWLDYQPSSPIPESITEEVLVPANLDPTDAAYKDFVQGVHLSTVRANDGAASPSAAPTPGTTP